jgi:hypothetical protein
MIKIMQKLIKVKKNEFLIASGVQGRFLKKLP